MQKTNFHLIVEKIIEIKSIHIDLARIDKYTNENSCIDVKHCYVKFIPEYCLTINNLHLLNCEIESDLDIKLDFFTHKNHLLHMIDFCCNGIITIFNFMQIRMLKKHCCIKIVKMDSFLKFILKIKKFIFTMMYPTM